MGRRHRSVLTQLLTTGLVLSVLSCSSTSAAACEADAISFRAVTQLTSFSDWVRANGVSGVIGEVGWPNGPDAPQWNALAGRWYDQTATDKLGVFAWSAAERWPATYPLAIYRSTSADTTAPQPFVTGSQAPVVEGHPPPSEAPGGVSLADGSFGASWSDTGSYSAATPGVYGVDYSYPSVDFLRSLRSRGVQQVRMAITWERLQPTPGGPLDAAGVTHLRTALSDAAAAGLTVVVDLHNYGRYAQGAGPARTVRVLGSPGLPGRDLADFWRRLTLTLHDEPAVSGFGLMDEPHDLPGGAPGWESASTDAVSAIRETNTSTPVFVGGYDYSSAARWSTTHPRPWIPTTLWPVVYEAHQYFDAAGEGVYTQSYAAENANAQAAGWTRCSAPRIGQ